MIVNIGSKNPVKIKALEEALKDYEMFKDAQIISLDVSSDVSSEPYGIEETARGARNRAFNSFIGCDYSVGLESGIIEVPYTKTGTMDICFGAVYDRKEYAFGLSCGLEFPVAVMYRIKNYGENSNEAFRKAKLTNENILGNTNLGGIGLVTNGRISRKTQCIQAIQTALVQIENKELY